MEKSMYISRTDAAVQLGVSLRTLDRYVKRKGIHTRREGKNLLLRGTDVERLQPYFSQRPEVMPQHESPTPSSTYEAEPTSAVAAFMNEPVSHGAETELRNLVGALQQQVATREHKIELLSYKLGVMETKLNQSIPLKDHAQFQIKAAEESANKQASIMHLTYLYRRARMLKNVYAVVVGAVLLGAIFYLTGLA